MKFNLLLWPGKATWKNNKPFLWFILSLLLIHSILKIIFYQYNHQLLFNGTGSGADKTQMLILIKWSLMQDLLVILLVNAIFLLALTIGRFISPKITVWFILPVFILINSFAIVLNLADIFYFRFHMQRANADLLYVLDNSANRVGFFTIALLIIAVAAIIVSMSALHKRFFNSFTKGNYGTVFVILFLAGFTVAVAFRRSFSKILVPAYPLIELKSRYLPFIQNSMHTFSYSVFRKGEGVQLKYYMSNAACDSLMPIRKTVPVNTSSNRQNIVLFIMESVPYDFFDSSGSFKVQMPFFDSLLARSSFYNNAYCYALESNKGITAILSGLPTVTDIPLYHSGYVNMPITPVGTALSKLNYRSLFCIGDEFDNFGFAKCMKWLGINTYYSKEDIPGYKKLPAHTMGLQDEAVIDFFRQKITGQQDPFFAIHYNISTHYPYDIPASFSRDMPANYTAAMKAMRYYDHSLQKFFEAAKKESWFSNTKFIFCSDHWLFPEGRKGKYDQRLGFRIPIIIFDPAINKKEIIEYPASQFDILETILQTAGYRDSIISYGNSLLDSSKKNRIAFSRASANLFQAFDSSYVLGYNNMLDKAEFLYNYRTDKTLQNNLVADRSSQPVLKGLTLRMLAFLQKIRMQQNGNPFK